MDHNIKYECGNLPCKKHRKAICQSRFRLKPQLYLSRSSTSPAPPARRVSHDGYPSAKEGLIASSSDGMIWEMNQLKHHEDNEEDYRMTIKGIVCMSIPN